MGITAGGASFSFPGYIAKQSDILLKWTHVPVSAVRMRGVFGAS